MSVDLICLMGYKYVAAEVTVTIPLMTDQALWSVVSITYP